jgi:type VI protein secretion system component Hcp
MIRPLTILTAVVALAVSPQAGWAPTLNARTNLQAPLITKNVDKASPNLFKNSTGGKHFEKVVLR